MQEAVNEFAVERMPDIGADILEGRPPRLRVLLACSGEPS